MRTTGIVCFSLITAAACAGSDQKPFDQMTAQEHRAAAAREHDLADDSFAKVRADNSIISPPETIPGSDYIYAYDGYGGAIPYVFDPYYYELGSPESYIAWPRVHDPSDRHEGDASEHREKALRHERRAAALEGRPSPQPLPPES